MPNTVKEIRLICADLDKNHNKFWTGKLYDDGSVETFWGRVGDPPAHKLFPGEGESGLDKRAKDKMKVRSGKPPYVELKTVETGATSKSTVQIVASSELEALALKQIVSSRPETRTLIGRLVRSNIHKITSSTNISYNATTGLFQTELGIVTPDGITEARDILAKIQGELDGKRTLASSLVNQYLCIVPQNIGRTRITAASLFPDNAAVQKQSDILDSLESSYQAIQKPAAAPVATKTAEEQIFSLDLDVMDKNNEYDRLNKWYEGSKKAMHGYDNVRIVNIYTVSLRGSKYDQLGNEKEVFHGTSEANLLSILKSGFRVTPPATAHIAGALFGAGIYGALHSTKSLGYSKGRWGGSQGTSAWLFVCDFAMGKTFETTSWGARRPAGYDSIWAKSTNGGGGLYHDELIVPKESQAKIKYLLECK